MLPRPAPASSATALPVPRQAPAWRLATLAGRLCEVSADAAGSALTTAVRLVVEAQRASEPAAWIGSPHSPFYPPDAAAAGVDVAALPVVWARDAMAMAGAADLLVRSGAFGLVVLDLGPGARLPIHAQTRLAALAQQHRTAVVCLTEKGGDRPSLGSLVSLRAHVARGPREEDRFRCEIQVLKDKRRGPGWGHVELCRGPDGLV
jgi:recombination protein RecA